MSEEPKKMLIDYYISPIKYIIPGRIKMPVAEHKGDGNSKYWNGNDKHGRCYNTRPNEQWIGGYD
jgi:hypothetical protein